jgi:hypothetical protein
LPPSSGWMNPKPFWLLKNFTVPVVIQLFSQIVPHTGNVPQAGANVRAAPTCVKRARPVLMPPAQQRLSEFAVGLVRQQPANLPASWG